MEILDVIESISQDLNSIDASQKATKIASIARKHYNLTPKNDIEFLEICELLLGSSVPGAFSVATLWMKRRNNIIKIEHFETIERWLYEFIHDWGSSDQFCYRILNPFVEAFPECFSHTWIASDNPYIRRASAVCLIRSSRGFIVSQKLSRVLFIVNSLKDDPHIHVQKGIGWLLKYAYLTYPEQILEYLRENVKELSRTTFRYALEKVPKLTKDEYMNLQYQ